MLKLNKSIIHDDQKVDNVLHQMMEKMMIKVSAIYDVLLKMNPDLNHINVSTRLSDFPKKNISQLPTYSNTYSNNSPTVSMKEFDHFDKCLRFVPSKWRPRQC